jgi:outer membrane protein OmpA-like peptidoglycan-associated protein
VRRLALTIAVAGGCCAPVAAQAAGLASSARIVALPSRIEPLRSVMSTQDLQVDVIESEGERAFAVSTDLLFAFGSARLSTAGASVLRRLARSITAGPVRVVGHADSRGPEGYNQRLSLRRATAVARVLRVALRSPAIGITVRGMGEHEPVASNNRPGGRRRNRRVEIRLPGG